MTFAIGTDCANLTITSQLITDFVGEVYDSLKISIDINCCGSPVEKTLQVTDITAGTYIVTPAFFGFEDALEDGVYKVTLTAVDPDDVTVEEEGCVLIDCETSCAIAKHRASNPTADSPFLIQLIKDTEECNCICDSLCVIYKQIQTELNGTSDTC